MKKNKRFNGFLKVARVVILSVFVINLLVAAFLFFAVPSQVRAADDDGPIDYEKTLEAAQKIEEGLRTDGYVRVEVPIPGLTAQSVDFPTLILDKNGNLETKIKKRYYVESLPVYITKIYSLSIGILAIVAVVMIMVSGIKWIFAGGNAYSVTEAKKGIMGAVSALVLALCSYMILYFISPRLVEVNFEVSSIDKLELNDKAFCNEIENQGGQLEVMVADGFYDESAITSSLAGYDDIAVNVIKNLHEANSDYVKMNNFSFMPCGIIFDMRYPPEYSEKIKGQCAGGSCPGGGTCAVIGLRDFACLDGVFVGSVENYKNNFLKEVSLVAVCKGKKRTVNGTKISYGGIYENELKDTSYRPKNQEDNFSYYISPSVLQRDDVMDFVCSKVESSSGGQGSATTIITTGDLQGFVLKVLINKPLAGDPTYYMYKIDKNNCEHGGEDIDVGKNLYLPEDVIGKNKVNKCDINLETLMTP
jgi:hypothetical protein